MNNKQVLARLEEIRREFESRLANVKEQLAEAEKPKLRHGDFGMWKGTNYGFVVDKSEKDKIYTHLLWKSNDLRNQKRQDDMLLREISIFGNVFDLMKGWDKPFEEYDADKYATGIMIREAKIRIYACTGKDCKKEDCSCGLFLNEAKDFYNALGHAIADLKRKQGD